MLSLAWPAASYGSWGIKVIFVFACSRRRYPRRLDLSVEYYLYLRLVIRPPYTLVDLVRETSRDDRNGSLEGPFRFLYLHSPVICLVNLHWCESRLSSMDGKSIGQMSAFKGTQADWIRVCLPACFSVYFSVCLCCLSVCLRCLTIFLTLCRTAQCINLITSTFHCASNRDCQCRLHVAWIKVWHFRSLPGPFDLQSGWRSACKWDIHGWTWLWCIVVGWKSHLCIRPGLVWFKYR